MAKALTKQVFGVPSLQVAEAIGDSDKVATITAAHFRLSARMRELENQFEAKACELRAEFLAEVAEIHGAEAV